MESAEDCSCIPVLRREVGPWRLSVERKSPTGAELSTHYSQVARSWSSRIRALGFGAAYRALIRQLVAEDILRLPSGATRVLDAGIGAGDLSLAFLKEVDRPVRLYGIDLCPDMLEVSAERLNAAGAQFHLKRGDITELPFSKGQFDLVLVGHVLEHLSAPSRALAELRRVLKPGAPLVLIATRPTALGKMIQAWWGTRCFGEAELSKMLSRTGVNDTQFFPFPSPPWCRWLSRACVAVF